MSNKIKHLGLTGQECTICGQQIKKGQEKFVSCQELNFAHGKECNCGLVIGAGCYKKFKAEQKKKLNIKKETETWS